jgi:hypothetical protein
MAKLHSFPALMAWDFHLSRFDQVFLLWSIAHGGDAPRANLCSRDTILNNLRPPA